MDELRFLNRYAKITFSRNRLPHWEQLDATYFISFRLADSIPAALAAQWREEQGAWLRVNPKPWSAEQDREYSLRFMRRIEQLLDEAHGSCILRRADIRDVVATALMHFDQARHYQHAWVVMPNHVHVLVSLRASWDLRNVLQSWKGFSAREINRLLKQRRRVWQPDYFDRIIRDTAHFWRCARYIRSNPARARLCSTGFLRWESAFVKTALDAAFQPRG